MNSLFQYHHITHDRKYPKQWEEMAHDAFPWDNNSEFIFNEVEDKVRIGGAESGYCFRYGHRTMKVLL